MTKSSIIGSGSKTEEAKLCDEYAAFLQKHNLPRLSANELQMEASERGLIFEQVEWLKNFNKRWEDWEERQFPKRAC